MRRWASYLWRALTALGETGSPWDLGHFDRTWPSGRSIMDQPDDVSVRAAFRSIMEREWGPAAFDPPGRPGSGEAPSPGQDHR